MGWRTILRAGALLVAVVMLLSTVAVASAADRWTPLRYPADETADDYAVSCVSASSCYVAGAVGNSGFMHFDGSRLSTRPSPPFGPAADSDLASLACTSTRFCVAVGDRNGVPAAADRWNRRRWTVTPVPVDPPAGFQDAKFVIAGLLSAACPSSSQCLVLVGCVALGGWGTAPHKPTPSAGTLWATLTPGHPHVSTLRTRSDLSMLSCPTIRFCLAGGNESIERFDHASFNGNFFGG